MSSYQNWSIKTKLSLIALFTCITALGLACAALFSYEVRSFKRTLVNDLKAQATILGGLSTAALAFDDSTTTTEMLGELKNQKRIRWAVIYKGDRHFAQYRNPKVTEVLPSQPPALPGEVFGSDGLRLNAEIYLKEDHIGNIYLCADTSELRSRLWEYGGIMALVFMAASLIALLMASRLQRAIVDPVQRLADTARIIAKDQNYSVRVEHTSQDELGQLTGAFNQMLNRIQAQDAALREGRERFEIAVAGARDGIWDWNLATNQLYLSPQGRAMLGLEDGELMYRYEDWLNLLHPEDRSYAMGVMTDYLKGKRPIYEVEFRLRHKDGSYRWILARGAALRDEGGKPYRMAGSHTDITERKQVSEQLTLMQRELVEASRLAGKAEVATNVLHNVGNILNSVNVSTTLVVDQLRKSETATLAKTVQMMLEHKDDLYEFLTKDPKGRHLPAFLAAISEQLTREQTLLATEAQDLRQNVDHIKQIISTQQSYAKVSGAMERLAVDEMLEDALHLSAAALASHQIEIVRQFGAVPLVLADRHLVLQILINLFNNAMQALSSRSEGRQIILRVVLGKSDCVRVEVCDNGIGIPRENLIHIFSHGFTTKKDGHGFGLHSGANAAKDMGGSLYAQSDGPGTGATLILELPFLE